MNAGVLTPFTMPSGGTLTNVAGYNQIFGIAQGVVDSTTTATDTKYQTSDNYTSALINASFNALQTTGWTAASSWKTMSGAAQSTRPFGPAKITHSNPSIETTFPGPRIYGPGIADGTRVISGSVVTQGTASVILWRLDKPIDLTAVDSAYYTAGSTTVAPINTYRISHINPEQAPDADTTLMGYALPLTQAGGSSLTHLKETIISHLKRGIKITPVKIKKRALTKRAK
jgi:hypothetical protein